MNVIGYISNYIPQSPTSNKQHQESTNESLLDLAQYPENDTNQQENFENAQGLNTHHQESLEIDQLIRTSADNNLTSAYSSGTLPKRTNSLNKRLSQVYDNTADQLALQGQPPMSSKPETTAPTAPTSVSTSYKIWRVIIFVPNLLIVRPILFVWYIVTFPLTIIEMISSYALKSNDSTPSSAHPGTPNIPSSVNDLSNVHSVTLKQDFIKDGTPTPSQQPCRDFGGKFFFPKKLIPNSIMNNPNKKKTLVLDLDETLIHSVSKTSNMSNKAHVVEVQFVPSAIPPIFQNTTSLKQRRSANNNSSASVISTLYYVNKRPYCDLFLNKVCKWYNVVIFTASIKEYADPVINWLESSTRARFVQRLYRQDCTLKDGIGYVKDLSILCHSLDDVIIIDNSPISYSMNIDNAIHVESWINDPTDSDLLQLLPFLEAMRYTTDVKTVLCLKRGEEVFH
ncbi:hypothetical protein ACO0QE_000103 [Hanseniaspora vineae]